MTNLRSSSQTLKELAREMIGNVLGFRDCPPALLDELVAGSSVRHMARGEFVVRRGDRHSQSGMLVAGLLENSALHPDGSRHLLGLTLPAGMFGLVGVIDGQRHTHDVSARDDCSILSIPTELLRSLRQRDVSFVLACERQIAHRLRLIFDRLVADSSLPLEVRAASMLHMIATLYGRPQGGHIVLDVKLSQSDLADWLGLSRQRVNFALRQLAAEGLIDLHYASLTILDPAGLEAKAVT